MFFNQSKSAESIAKSNFAPLQDVVVVGAKQNQRANHDIDQIFFFPFFNFFNKTKQNLQSNPTAKFKYPLFHENNTDERPHPGREAPAGPDGPAGAAGREGDNAMTAGRAPPAR